MKKLSLAAILAIGCMQNVHAQTADQAVAKDKMYDQYIGVQLNGLIRQVFNFNNSTTATGTSVNPYLLTYSINSKKTGWGLRAGIGYNYNSTTGSDDGGISTTVTKINDLQARLAISLPTRLNCFAMRSYRANIEDLRTSNILPIYNYPVLEGAKIRIVFQYSHIHTKTGSKSLPALFL